MPKSYKLKYLKQLEAESIYIIRETASTFAKPVMLYSIGKDSSVLLHLIRKAFYPGKIPFPLLHIDTGYKFREMIEFRDKFVKKIKADLIVYKNKEEQAEKFGPEDAGTEEYIYYKKTKPLLEAFAKYGFDAALGGARRDEEKSRSKERIFSHRDTNDVWDPKNQRPSAWHLYNTKIKQGEGMRVFPLSNWTELDIWQYIKEENIEIVPLYFAKKRKLVKRNDQYLMIDDFVRPKEGEEVIEEMARYRTLGCSPSTGAVLSRAKNINDVIEEISNEKQSERENRTIDQASLYAMEKKKKEGYF